MTAEPRNTPAHTLRYAGGAETKVIAGHGVLRKTGELMLARSPQPHRVVLCGDTAVFAAQGEPVLAALREAGLDVVTLVQPPGEEQKQFANVARAYEELAARGIERGDVLIVLGGGVPGDLFGFVAATYLRGLRLIQAPTTVVAQVDSSIGGKVGVDLPAGKNLVGAFKHPELVLIDYQTLHTLPDGEWISGSAEILKSGVIADAALFDLLAADPVAWRTRAMAVEPALAAALAVKARLVQEDEFERGARMHLNYGHTLGHAIEAAAGYGPVRHGEAIAWGMAMAARLSARLGLSDMDFVARQDRALHGLGLLAPLPALAAGEVYDRLFADKKVRHGRLRWILPHRAPGAVSIREDVPTSLVRELVEATVAGTLLA